MTAVAIVAIVALTAAFALFLRLLYRSATSDHQGAPMPSPRPARLRPALSAWATAVLRRCYPGQRPEDVIDQALRLKATADGHLQPDGRIKRGSGQPRRPA